MNHRKELSVLDEYHMPYLKSMHVCISLFNVDYKNAKSY